MGNYAHPRAAAKASKSLLVGLNLFYTEGSLQGFADHKVENYCLMGGSTGAWKHSRDARCVAGLDDLENLFQPWWFYDAARDVPNQPVLGFTHRFMISVQAKAESHHCQKRLTALKHNLAHKAQFKSFCFSAEAFQGIPESRSNKGLLQKIFKYLCYSLHYASVYPTEHVRRLERLWKVMQKSCVLNRVQHIWWTGYEQEHGLNLAPFQRFKMNISIDWRSKAWNNCLVADYFMHSSE